MIIFFIILSVLSSPKEDKLFKTLFLIKYSQEYSLYKNDINFNEKELKNILKKEIKNRLKLFRNAKKTVEFNKEKYFQKIFDLKQQYNTKYIEDIAVKNQIPKKIILKNLEIDTYIEVFLSKVLFKDIKVTQEEIENYYYSNLESFIIKREVLLYHIFLSSKPKIIKVKKELNDKKNNFELLAKKYSEAPESLKNGYIGWVNSQATPSYFKPAFKIKKGKYSNIIQSNIGYHIFYVKDIKTNKYEHIGNVKNKIKFILLSQKQEKKINIFLTNGE